MSGAQQIRNDTMMQAVIFVTLWNLLSLSRPNIISLLLFVSRIRILILLIATLYTEM